MELTNAFHEAVASGDVRSVRIMMKDSLLIDPSFVQFEQMEEAACSLQGLYEAHDGRDFQDKNTWDDNYMNKLMVQVVSNFSHERVNHLKEVVNYLRPVANSIAESEFSSPNSQKKVSEFDQQDPYTDKKNNCRTVKTANPSSSSHNSQKKGSSYREQKAHDQKEGNYQESKIVIGTIGGATIGGVGAAIAGCTIVAGGAVTSGVIGGVVAGGVIGGAVAGGVVGAIVNSSNRIKKD